MNISNIILSCSDLCDLLGDLPSLPSTALRTDMLSVCEDGCDASIQSVTLLIMLVHCIFLTCGAVLAALWLVGGAVRWVNAYDIQEDGEALE